LKILKLPEQLTLCDGVEVQLAPMAMNRRFLELMSMCSKDADTIQVIDAMLDCIHNSIRNGNKDLPAEQLDAAREQIPFNFVIELIDSVSGSA